MSFNPDIPANINEDLLGRKDFAKIVAKGLVESFENGSESLVLGINGSWGSGKSTLLKFIQEEIDKHFKGKEEPYKIFNFNPWMFSEQKELQRIFLYELSKQFNSLKSVSSEIIKSLSGFVKKLSFVKYIHGGLGDFQKDVSGTLENYVSQTQESLEELKLRVNELLKEAGIKLFIFIDDLDRLNPFEVTEVFRLIKLNADFVNTFYIIAYDKEVVEGALVQQYKKLGKKYLEKIIQVDYSLPEILEEEIEEIFLKELNKLFQKNKINLNAEEILNRHVWHKYGFKLFFRNIRDIRRYINGLQLRLPQIYQEVDMLDFLLLEGLRVFDYQSYIGIYKDISTLKGIYTEKNNLQERPFYKNSQYKKIIDYLLPKKTNVTSLRLFHTEHFDKYYALKITSGKISQLEYQSFIENPETRLNITENALQTDNLNKYYIYIKNDIRKLKEKNIDAHLFIRDLFMFWDNGTRDESFLKHVGNFIDMIVEVCDINPNSLIDFLKINDDRWNVAKFYTLYFMHNNQTIMGRMSKELLELVDANKDKLMQVFKNIMDKWSFNFMSDNLTDATANITNDFLLFYAKYSRESYINRLQEVLQKSEKFLLELVGMFIINFGENEFMLEMKNKDLLFPNSELFGTFLERINSINLTNYPEYTKKRTKFFIKETENL